MRGILAVLATVIVVVSIGFLSLTSRLGQIMRIFGSDKTAHALAYGVLAFILAYTLSSIMTLSIGRAMLWAIILSCIFGALFECMQYFLPHRQVDWYDILANIVGASIGGVIFWLAKIVVG